MLPLPTPTLHLLARQGDFMGMAALLASLLPTQPEAVNAFDARGYSPLMYAVQSPKAELALVRLLLQVGADPNAISPSEWALSTNVLQLALRAGAADKVQLLLQFGAQLHYRDPHGHGALLDAVFGLHHQPREAGLSLLRELIGQRVALELANSHGQCALSVLSNQGRFDAVALLLEAGADDAALAWTTLTRAVALGSLSDVQAELRGTPNLLEARDGWDRTPWLVALLAGDEAKARYLMAQGADTQVAGRCGQPPLFYALEGGCLPLLAWLIEPGQAQSQLLDRTDDFGCTALKEAAEAGREEAVRLLLKAGASLQTDADEHMSSALAHATRPGVIKLLLQAGAAPRELTHEGRRALLGLPAEPDDDALHTVSAAQFQQAATRRFGQANPEPMDEPFWLAMLHAGVTGHAALQHFSAQLPEDSPLHSWERPPIWCAQRFGQSFTLLPDGRMVLVGGEHEDSYDPDFCIYNDVAVIEPDGRVQLFGYPQAVFAPTNFHTATWTAQGDSIILIGGLGYRGQRQLGHTPVYRLCTRSWAIEALSTQGEAPGWLNKHQARALGDDEIEVWDGQQAVLDADGDEQHQPLPSRHVLNLRTLQWRRLDAA